MKMATIPLAVVAEEATVPPNAASGDAEAPEAAPTGALVQFAVPLGRPGRTAIVALPPGMTAVEMLVLIGQMPSLGSAASKVPVDPEAQQSAAIRAKLLGRT